MSQRNKLSLWQKLKRLLTASAPQSVVDGANSSTQSSAADDDIDLDLMQAGISSANTRNSDEANTADSTGSFFGQRDNNDSERSQAEAKLKASQHEPNDTSIVDCLKQYFNDKQWHYTHYRPQTSGDKSSDSQTTHHLSLRMRHKQLNCGYLFRVQEKTKLLAVYGILPFLIPESHQSAAMLLITQINYDMLIGNLEMDINDGEIRYKHAVDVETVGINDEIIEHLLQSVIAMTTVANELFSDLLNNQDPAEDMQTLLIELRQQSDSKTFFLPTQFVQ
ncbi:YbjN domain-containing protein [Psychrobacter sp. N25K4-3-2]|uniref:YbjN domain-containing protein n=1 Tax=Psychrobacter sp. N25K4-3-2 TaxID=2785026 RepID=UPI00188D9019|nr:YbjN domain-containing protein [Psychrobacter sp. N25K4-3-2]MBF4489198.1 YbjN domain-containing protein [Psychrobacter sp. N25K4-3-2]